VLLALVPGCPEELPLDRFRYPCVSDAECASGWLCGTLSTADEPAFECLKPCVDDTACPPGSVCDCGLNIDDRASAVCVAEEMVADTPCLIEEGCLTKCDGTCGRVDLEPLYQCLTPCGDGCAEGLSCVMLQVVGTSERAGLCVPAALDLLDAPICSTESACPGNAVCAASEWLLSDAPDLRCANGCETDADCPSGELCHPSQDELGAAATICWAPDDVDVEPPDQDVYVGEDVDATDPDEDAPDAAEDAALDVWEDGTDVGPDTADDNGGRPCSAGVGCVCVGDDDCQVPVCVSTGAASVCTGSCESNADCPGPLVCLPAGPSDGKLPDYICLAPQDKLCQPCTQDADCAVKGAALGAHECVSYGTAEGGQCGTYCGKDGICPDGYSCDATGDSAQCVKDDGQCGCSSLSKLLALTTPCATENGAGSCAGQRVCGFDGLSVCDAAVPADDVCDGQDNDCDGATDEVCDDGIACTVDVCDADTGQCSKTPDDSACAPDEDECTTAVCDPDDGCVQLPSALQCDDGNPCTTDACDSETGQCANTPADGTPCNDGNACTTEDTCSGDSCEGTPQSDVTCDDGDGCTVGDACTDGACVPGSAPDCSSADEACAVGACVNLAPDEHACAPVPKAAGDSCDDGKYCTSGDQCNADGACEGNVVDCAVSDGCKTGTCQEGAQGCVTAKLPEGADCNDDDACTAADSCVNGQCKGTTYVCGEQQISVLEVSGYRPALADLGFGRYATQWTWATVQNSYGLISDGTNALRLSDASGSRENEETPLSIPGSPYGNALKGFQWRSPIAMHSSGEFLVMGHNGHHGLQSTSKGTINIRWSAQTFDHTGALKVDWTQVIDYGYSQTNFATHQQVLPLALGDSSYRILHAMHTQGNGGDGSVPGAVQMWSVDAALNTSAPVTLVAQGDAKHTTEWAAAVVPDGTDELLVAWASQTGDKVYARRFTSTGVAVFAEPALVHEVGAAVYGVRLVPFQDGRFVVLWEGEGIDGDGRGIALRRFDSDGAPLSDGPLGVNASVLGDQRLGDVDAFSDGSFVVVYADELGDTNGYGVKARRFTSSAAPDGAEVAVNHVRTAGNQRAATVKVLSDDAWIAAFVEVDEEWVVQGWGQQLFNGTVWTRRFDKAGVPQSGRLETTANLINDGAQSRPAAGTAGNGNVLVAYESGLGKTKGGEVGAALFDSAGGLLVAEGAVNTTLGAGQRRPAVAGGPDGFFVVWESEDQDGSSDGIFGRRYDVDGVAQGGELGINTTTTGYQRRPAVATDANGRSLVAWTAVADVGGEITVRTFAADGTQLAGEKIVAAVAAGAQDLAAVTAVLGSDEFIVAWQAPDPVGVGVYARRVAADGALPADPVLLNTTVGAGQTNAAIGVVGDILFACWESLALGDADVVCGRYDSESLAIEGAEFSPAGSTDEAQLNPAIVVLPSGQVVVGWDTMTPGIDSDGAAVQVQRYNSDGKAIGPRIVANRTWPGDQERPALTPSGDNDVFVGFESPDDDASGVTIRVLPAP